MINSPPPHPHPPPSSLLQRDDKAVQMKAYLNSPRSTIPILPPGSAFLLGQLWGDGVQVFSTGGARLQRSQHWTDPTLFRIKTCKYGELALFQISRPSVVAGIPPANSPGRRPSEKASGHTQTHAPQKGLQAPASSLVSLGEILAQSSSKWKPGPPQQIKKKINTAALKATTLNNNVLPSL